LGPGRFLTRAGVSTGALLARVTVRRSQARGGLALYAKLAPKTARRTLLRGLTLCLDKSRRLA